MAQYTPETSLSQDLGGRLEIDRPLKASSWWSVSGCLLVPCRVIGEGNMEVTYSNTSTWSTVTASRSSPRPRHLLGTLLVANGEMAWHCITINSMYSIDDVLL